MKAIGTNAPGALSSLQLLDVPEPAAGPGEVRVQVHASACNPADFKIVQRMAGAGFIHAKVLPLVPGCDFAGVLDHVGEGVADLAPGDAVYGHLPYRSANRQGAFAERITISAGEVGRVPKGVEHATAAAAATVGLTALQGLRDQGGLEGGGRVLVLGASGGVGSLAAGIAKRLGAHVTGVCSSYAVEFVRSLGADAVVDRTTADPLQHTAPFDVVFDTTGRYSYGACAKVLTPEGAFVTVLPTVGFLLGKIRTLFSRRRCRLVVVRSKRADLEQLGAWLADGLPVQIAECVPVRDVASALERLQAGGRPGKIAVEVRVAGSGTLVVRYHYDALDRRFEKSTGLSFVFDGPQVIEEYSAGSPVADMVHRGCGVGPGGWPNGRRRPPLQVRNANGVYDLQEDSNGSVTTTTNENGELADRYDYTPTGVVTAQAFGLSSNNPYLFQGLRSDPETGFQTNEHGSYYIPSIGRSSSRSPEASANSLGNAFTSGRGDAVNTRLWDALGSGDESSLVSVASWEPGTPGLPTGPGASGSFESLTLASAYGAGAPFVPGAAAGVNFTVVGGANVGPAQVAPPQPGSVSLLIALGIAIAAAASGCGCDGSALRTGSPSKRLTLINLNRQRSELIEAMAYLNESIAQLTADLAAERATMRLNIFSRARARGWAKANLTSAINANKRKIAQIQQELKALNETKKDLVKKWRALEEKYKQAHRKD
ncbi:MAG: NADP-dependent oxidoreductase [Planctomycetota bacterium]|jgi:NADPH:quinone reductase-like Zn-dependent oxidoreductase